MGFYGFAIGFGLLVFVCLAPPAALIWQSLAALAFIALIIWMMRRLRQESTPIQFQPQKNAQNRPHSPNPVAQRTPIEVSERATLRGGKSTPTDAVFDAWTSGDLHAMVAVLKVPTNHVERHHLLNGIVAGAYKRRTETYYADLCASTAETYLEEMPGLMQALKKEWKGLVPKIDVFQQYAALLAERQEFDRAIEVCQIAIDQNLHDGTKSGYEGRIARIEKLRAKAEPHSKKRVVPAVAKRPQPETLVTASVPAQSWQATIGKGAAEIDRLVAAGDWDSARAALQRIAYGMVDADPQDKQQFTQAMCQFAARDPLYHAVLQIATPLIDATPGMLQTKLYPHLPDVDPEAIRYVLYYAAELGAVVRRKKGNSYAMFSKSHTVDA